MRPIRSVQIPNLEVRSVAVDADGRVFVAGNTVEPDGPNENPIVIQFDADGNEGWTYMVDTDSTDLEYVADMAITPSGDIVIASIEHEHDFAFSEAAYATRIDAATGDSVWSREVPGVANQGEAEAPRLAVDASGNVFLANSEVGQGSHHALVMTQYDPDGNRLNRTVREDTHSIIVGVEAQPTGGFAMLALLDDLGVGSPMYEPYLVRTTAGGEFLEDLSLDGRIEGTRRFAVGPEGDFWWLDGDLTRTNANIETQWVHDFSGFIGRGVAVRRDGVAYALGVGGQLSDVRAVSAEGEGLWDEEVRLARDIAAGGRVLAWAGTEEGPDGTLTGWIETRRIPSVP